MQKSEKGITLVALIITVIVLLILAGVAISTVMGNEGILTKSKNAVEAYKNAEQNEALVIENAYQQMNYYYDIYSTPAAN